MADKVHQRLDQYTSRLFGYLAERRRGRGRGEGKRGKERLTLFERIVDETLEPTGQGRTIERDLVRQSMSSTPKVEVIHPNQMRRLRQFSLGIEGENVV